MINIATGIQTEIFGAGDPCGLLIGQRVALDASKPALRLCRHCGHDTGVLTGPTGPHHDGVRCEQCHKHLGWLPPPAGSEPSLIED